MAKRGRKRVRSERYKKEWNKAYNRWYNMKSRCHNSEDKQYRFYGARGIQVCDRWQDFRTYSNDVGWPLPGYQLDRIDNDGNYEPRNVRWVTPKENGESKRWSFTKQAEALGVPYGRYRDRLKKGQDPLAPIKDCRAHPEIKINGVTATLFKHAQQAGVSYHRVLYRYKAGWPHDQLLRKETTPGKKFKA